MIRSLPAAAANPNLRIDPRKQEFARRLEVTMDVKGVGPAELARRVQALLPEGSKFQHAHIAQYRRGLAIPRPKYLNAICAALEVSPTDLVPATGPDPSAGRATLWITRETNSESSDERQSEESILSVADDGDGFALLKLRQKVPWPIALEILRLLQSDLENGKGGSSK